MGEPPGGRLATDSQFLPDVFPRCARAPDEADRLPLQALEVPTQLGQRAEELGDPSAFGGLLHAMEIVEGKPSVSSDDRFAACNSCVSPFSKLFRTIIKFSRNKIEGVCALSNQHWIDRAGYWRERAEKAEAELKEMRRHEADHLSDDEAAVFYAVVIDVGEGEVRLAVPPDVKELPPAGARVEVRVRWSPRRR